jgi:hypothetical protein
MNKKEKIVIDKANKRFALFCSIWSFIGAIPLLFITSFVSVPNTGGFGLWEFAVIGWMTWTIAGVVISPKIINKIWK